MLNVGATMTLSSEFAFSWKPQITIDGSTDSVNDLVPADTKPLLEPVLNEICVSSCFHPFFVKTLKFIWKLGIID